ncbi:MAG: D-tyrosyl-tRNA(Tyr) deacylase, partial [candidate division NC10 bacterium]|nr:D-tyrosyl-tRNA(Tyr) deacylase [candidate division NC10 bacterium]
AAIGPGLLVLLGVGQADTAEAARWLAGKVADLRIFEDTEGKMNRSVRVAGGAILVVSQFTLYADTRKGRRPSFTGAAPPEAAVPLVRAFVEELEGRGLPVQEGVFGARMQVRLVNDGPVTILLDTAER